MFFVTNNSTKSRAGYLKKFTSLGLNIDAEEIYSSSYAAAAYLESIGFNKKVRGQAEGRGGESQGGAGRSAHVGGQPTSGLPKAPVPLPPLLQPHCC
eukprot:361927-Chlamydomonas_euryale.AAC.4